MRGFRRLCVVALSACMTFASVSYASPRRFAWQMLRADEVRAEGWLRVQAQEDVREGLPGRLDEINEDVARQTFARQAAGFTPGQPSWWPGEQEGYWHEGLVHLAFLAEDAAAIRRVTEYVEAILKSQAPDGYIGIYGPEARLLPVSDPRYGEKGAELHTQAHGLLALIAFHEHTGRADVLAAVERAAQLTMRRYALGMFGTAGERTPKAGGNSHTVTFADPMIQLYRLTGNEGYLRFVDGMYEDYNRHPPRDRDLTSLSLRDGTTAFVGHGAHTAESFHMVQAAALLGDAEIQELPALALARLRRHLTPSGALVSGEMIDGHIGNGTRLYEHCTQVELLKSFVFLTQYTGAPAAADHAARLFFNAIQGARLHPAAALQYLSRDDRMDIPTDPVKKASNIRNEGSHFQMSSIIRPTCCSASIGRALPYFLAGAWMKTPAGHALAIMNFAPCRIVTKVADVRVEIQEITDYPFGDRVVLLVNPATPVKFDLAIRLPPEGALRAPAVADARVTRRDGMMVLDKEWRAGDRIELDLDMPVVCEPAQDGAARYYRRGALVFGLPFTSEIKTVAENPRWKDQKPSGLFEYDISVADKSTWGYRIDPTAKFEPVGLPGDGSRPWKRPTLGLKGVMLDAENRPREVVLTPVGATISRRATFLDASHTAQEAARQPGDAEIGIGY